MVLKLQVVTVCKDTKLLKAIHNNGVNILLNNQVVTVCKDTKLLKAIHNIPNVVCLTMWLLLSAKILNFCIRLAAPQQTEQARLHSACAIFESNSQNL
jgi:hypothetical protein